MEDRITFTRRRMLALAGSAMAGAALAGCSKTGPEPAPSPSTPERLSLTVYDPTGAMEITQVFAPRLDTLEGKTVAFISDDEWEAHRMFPMIAEYL